MIINFDLTFEYIIIGGLILFAMIGALFYLYSFWSDIRTKHPELVVLQAARSKKRIPAIVLIDPTGRMVFISGHKADPQNIEIDEKAYGLIFDPLKLTKIPNNRLEDGTPIYPVGVGFHFSTDINGGRALVQFINRVRKEYKKLNFIRDDIVLMELFTKSGEDLPKDIATVIKSYPPEDYIQAVKSSSVPLMDKGLMDKIRGMYGSEQVDEIPLSEADLEEMADITVTEIASIIEEIKGKTKTWMVKPEPFSIHEGLALLPIATMASDMLRLKSIAELKIMNSFNKAEEPIYGVMKIMALIIGFIILAYMIIVNVKPGA